MIESLLESSCWVIDCLPEQVPDGGHGQVFAVERFWLRDSQQKELHRHFAQILLRLNCFYDIQVSRPDEETGETNPEPEQLWSWVTQGKSDLLILLPDVPALIGVNWGDLYMTVYHASPELLGLLEKLSAAEGLFLWQPPQEKGR